MTAMGEPTAIAHLRYRKKPVPATAEIDAEMRRLLRYDNINGGFTWADVKTPNQRALIGKPAGGNDGKGYKCLFLLGHRFKVHRLVWLWHYGVLPDTMLDHVNGERSDNRIENLRESTAAENTRNRIRRSGELAVGVRMTGWGKFNARIQLPDGVKVFLGTYDTHAEAAAAYAGAATILHGDFAVFKSRRAGSLAIK